MEYLEGCNTAIRRVARKVGLYGLEMVLPWGHYFRTGGLVYDRTTICIEIHRGIYESTRNNKTAINSISFSNRWSNGKNQPRDRNVSMALCQLPIR